MTKAKAQEQGEAVAAVVAEQRIARQGDTPEVIGLMKLALEKGEAGVESLERLLTLHERVSDRAAAQEFAASLADFQSKCPSVQRKSTAKVNSSGAGFSYKYAELDEIAKTINPHLHPLGFSYSWDCEKIEGGLLCTCVLRHVNGHREKASFPCPTESRAGMSAQQKQAAALTYAKRQSLIQVLGLTTCDPDADGADIETITDDQALNIAALIDEVKADEKRFLKYLGVSEVHAIRAADYSNAIKALERKRR